MVTLPSVSPQVQQTGGFSAQGAQPMRSAVGEQLQQFGEGAQRAALGAYEVGLQAQQDYDTARSTELTTKFSNAARSAVAEYLRTTGRDAQSKRKATIDALEMHLREVQKGVENPLQESQFSPRAAKLVSDLMLSVDEHEAKETKTYKLAELGASAKEQHRQFLFWQERGDELLAGEALTNALTTTQEALRMQGVTDDSPLMQQTLLETRSAMHGSVMKRLSDTEKLDELKAYYSRLDPQSDLTPEVKGRVDAALGEMQKKADATTLAISLDSVPYVERVKRLDEQLQAGKLSEEVYQRALGAVEQREARAHRVAAQGRQQLLEQVNALLDQDRQQAGTGGMRTIDEVLPAPMLGQLKAQGLYGVAEQYALRGRRSTTPDGVALLAEARRDLTQLRGVPWDVIADGTWMNLDEQDTDRLASLWAEANQQPKPTKATRPDLGGLGMQGGDAWSFQLDRIYQLPPKPTQEQIDQRKRVEAKLDSVLRTLVQAKPNEDPRELLNDFVSGELARQVKLVQTGETIPLFLYDTRFTEKQLQEGPSLGELVVAVPDGTGQQVIPFSELRKPGVMESIVKRLEEMREIAAKANRPDEVARLDMVISARPEYELAKVYGELKVAAGRRGQVSGMQAAMQQAKATEEARREEDASVEQAWRYYRDKNPASFRHPWWESFRRWQFIGSEAARRENAKKWPNDPMFRFNDWHGTK